MERELIIAVKKNKIDDNKINREVQCIKNLFPYLESFETFASCNQVFDLEKRNVVYASNSLRTIYDKGVQQNNSFIIGLN